MAETAVVYSGFYHLEVTLIRFRYICGHYVSSSWEIPSLFAPVWEPDSNPQPCRLGRVLGSALMNSRLLGVDNVRGPRPQLHYVVERVPCCTC